jgi:two-component system alkaline phosphatase synthesis response regulator PhoP
LRKVYIVEDDDSIRELVLYALRNDFEAAGFAGGAEFFRALKVSKPDLVLLDIMLPGEDGLSILKRLRSGAGTAGLPVIMLTAKGGEYDRVKGLELGADDYVVKPFSVLELAARVKALIRRSGAREGDGGVTVGSVAVSPERRLVLVGGEEVALTHKEFELLYFLCKNSGLVFSRDRLLERIWGVDFEGETRTVDMHVKTLRQKLGAGGGIIKTVRGVGYKAGA